MATQLGFAHSCNGEAQTSSPGDLQSFHPTVIAQRGPTQIHSVLDQRTQ